MSRVRVPALGLYESPKILSYIICFPLRHLFHRYIGIPEIVKFQRGLSIAGAGFTFYSV